MGFKKFFALTFFVGALTGTSALAQLPAGSFGIGADLSRTFSTANILYAATPALQFQVGVGYDYRMWDYEYSNGNTSTTNSQNNSLIMASFGGKYFLKSTGMLPFIGVSAFYNIQPESKSTQSDAQTQIRDGNGFGASFLLGAQYFIAPPIALHAQFGIGFSKDENTMTTSSTNSVTGVTTTNAQTNTNTSLNFGNTSLGISFFF
ncbi:MAG: DUF3575 domain-containing protein [Bacteroidota bacterium]